MTPRLTRILHVQDQGDIQIMVRMALAGQIWAIWERHHSGSAAAHSPHSPHSPHSVCHETVGASEFPSHAN